MTLNIYGNKLRDFLQRISWFKFVFLLTTLLFALLLLLIIVSPVFIIKPSSFFDNIASTPLLFSITLSIITSSVSTVLVMIFALPVSYCLSRFSFLGKDFIRTIVDIPFAFPETVLGLTLLLFFGHPIFSDFIPIVFTKKGIVVAQFFTAISFAIRILKSSFDSIDTRVELVSRSLGKSQISTFVNITIPLAKHGLVAALLITFARCIGSFGAVLIVGGGMEQKTDTLPVFLFLNLSQGNVEMAITAGIILIVISFISMYFIEKLN